MQARESGSSRMLVGARGFHESGAIRESVPSAQDGFYAMSCTIEGMSANGLFSCEPNFCEPFLARPIFPTNYSS